MKIVFVIGFILLSGSIAFAQTSSASEATVSSDPFASALPIPVQQPIVPAEQGKPAINPDAGMNVAPDVDLSKFAVSGLVWGAAEPKAIVNGNVVGTGDKINDAEVVKISREGLLLRINGREILVKR